MVWSPRPALSSALTLTVASGSPALMVGALGSRVTPMGAPLNDRATSSLKSLPRVMPILCALDSPCLRLRSFAVSLKVSSGEPTTVLLVLALLALFARLVFPPGGEVLGQPVRATRATGNSSTRILFIAHPHLSATAHTRAMRARLS